jgi:hypothetical protein
VRRRGAALSVDGRKRPGQIGHDAEGHAAEASTKLGRCDAAPIERTRSSRAEKARNLLMEPGRESTAITRS